MAAGCGSRRAVLYDYFFLQVSSPSFCQAPGLLSTSVVKVTSLGLFRVTVVRLFIG